MFEISASTEKLDEALSKAQGEFKPAVFDSKNPHFGNQFASLTSIYEMCRPILAKYGISVTQWPVISEDGRVHMITRVAHKGEWIKSEFAVRPTKDDPQGYGSSITYLKRYAFSAALGIVSDEDDDGETAPPKTPSGPIENPTTKHFEVHSQEVPPPWVTDATPAPSTNDPGDYVSKFGKFSGKKIKDVPEKKLINYCKWLEDTVKKSGKPLGDMQKDFIHAADLYLNGKEGSINF